MSEIFISHVEEDERIARALAEGFRSAGYEPWYFEEHSLPGFGYVNQIVVPEEYAGRYSLVTRHTAFVPVNDCGYGPTGLFSRFR